MNLYMVQNQKPFVGGILITLGLLIGAGVGMAIGQPSAGFLAGLVVGSIAAVVKSFWDKKRGT